jgi:hypothetical protein
MLFQIMKLYVQRGMRRKSDRTMNITKKCTFNRRACFLVGISLKFSHNTGGALGWYCTFFRSCYLSNTREILSPCLCLSVSAGEYHHTVRRGYVWGKLWCVTTNRLLMNVTLNAGRRGVAAVGVDGGWLGGVAAPLHMLRRLGRI